MTVRFAALQNICRLSLRCKKKNFTADEVAVSLVIRLPARILQASGGDMRRQARMRQAMRWAAVGVVTGIMLGCGAANPALADDSAACGVETARQEKQQGIPDRLLHAISLVESGRWDADKRASFAWPWTVMAEGEGRFLPTKAAAIAEVEALQARGVKNIDVGCMQVNLLAHKGAFANLDEAFEPATNVGYGARFLMGLYSSTENWTTAAAYYHSQTPSLAAEYKTKLIAAWDAAKKRPDERLLTASLDSDDPENRPPIGLMLPAPPRTEADVKSLHGHNEGMEGARIASINQERTLAERAEAKRIADAYRQARIEEWRLRREQMAKMRIGKG